MLRGETSATSEANLGPEPFVTLKEAARRLGHLLAERGTGLVYGGGSVGMMGQLARAVLEKNGDVIGVIPKELVSLR